MSNSTRRRGRGPPTICTAFEPTLLGSAGTLWHNRAWVEDEEFFLAVNADNLTDFDPRSLIEFHQSGQADATLTVFRSEHPSRCGVVEVDPGGLVTGFTEKPAEPTSDLANAGMYAFSPTVLQQIDPMPPRDIGYHLLPQLVGRARALALDGYFRDIGTPTAYQQAVEDWRPRVSS